MQTTIVVMTLEATESFSLPEVEESTDSSTSEDVGEVEDDKSRTGIGVGLEVVEIRLEKIFEPVRAAVGSEVTDGVL